MTTATRPTTTPLFYTYDLTVEAITPLHVGNGETLLRDHDFVIHGDELIVLDIDRVYGRLFDQYPEERWAGLAELDLQQVMTAADARDPRLLRYPRMRLAPGVEGEGFKEVRACIRTAGGEAYLPGSSLKGAIRTAFATNTTRGEDGMRWISEKVEAVARAGGDPKRASQPIDRAIFGPNPQEDAMRALRPSDLYVRTDVDPVDTRRVDRHVQLVETRVTKRNGQSKANIMVEAFHAGTILDGTLTVEANPWSHLEQQWKDMWIDYFADGHALALGATSFLNGHAAALIDREKRYHAGTAIASEYVGLERKMESLGEGSALAWVGWGTGWEAKTYGESLTASPEFPQLHRTFDLARGHDPSKFPETRRLVFAHDRPVRPMGWVVVTITPRGER